MSRSDGFLGSSAAREPAARATISQIAILVTTLSIPSGPATSSAAGSSVRNARSDTLLPDPVRASLGEVVDRLHREYQCCRPLSEVLEVVVACILDIQATPPSALPELAERLARYRLAQLGHRP